MSRYANRNLAPPSANRGEHRPPSFLQAFPAFRVTDSRIDVVDYLGLQLERRSRLRGTKTKEDTATVTEHTARAQMTMMTPP